jgi:hypothetical protein
MLMALHTKMIPSMQVDFSVSSQEAKAEGTAGQYKESSTFMVGGVNGSYIAIIQV